MLRIKPFENITTSACDCCNNMFEQIYISGILCIWNYVCHFEWHWQQLLDLWNLHLKMQKRIFFALFGFILSLFDFFLKIHDLIFLNAIKIHDEKKMYLLIFFLFHPTVHGMDMYFMDQSASESQLNTWNQLPTCKSKWIAHWRVVQHLCFQHFLKFYMVVFKEISW